MLFLAAVIVEIACLGGVILYGSGLFGPRPNWKLLASAGFGAVMIRRMVGRVCYWQLERITGEKYPAPATSWILDCIVIAVVAVLFWMGPF